MVDTLSVEYMPTPPKKKKGRGKTVTTPEKAKISRYYQKLGGEDTRGAAVRTARKFGLTGSNGPARVKKYDEEVARNEARRKSVPGRPSTSDEGDVLRVRRVSDQLACQ